MMSVKASAVGLLEVKASAVELLEVLLEEINEQSNKLVQGILQVVDVDQIHVFICELWKLQQKWDERQEYRLQGIARKAMYRAFHVVRKMADYQGLSWKKLISNLPF